MNIKNAVIQKIKDLLEQKGEWKPSEELVAFAIKFIEVFPEDFEKPYVHYHLDNGDCIDFYWYWNRKIKIDLGVYSDETYAYYARIEDDEKEFMGEDISIETPLPKEIIELLKEKLEKRK